MGDQKTNEIIAIKQILSSCAKNKFIASPPPGLRCASVVLPLLMVDGKIHMLFTKRTHLVRDHQNQVSFPGGVCEEEDETPMHTACREFEEELGIPISTSEIAAAMPARETVTGYFIFPYIVILDDIDIIAN